MTIDVEQSIKHKRILYKWGWGSALNGMIDTLFWAILPVISFFIVANAIIRADYENVFLKLVFIIVSVFIIFGCYFRGKLVVIENGALPQNRPILIESLKSWCPEIEIIDTGTYSIKAYKSTGFFTWGGELVVLFDENNAYINSVTLGRHDIRSPFHAPFNYISLLRLKRLMTKVK